jgi:hypothetical protein
MNARTSRILIPLAAVVFVASLVGLGVSVTKLFFSSHPPAAVHIAAGGTAPAKALLASLGTVLFARVGGGNPQSATEWNGMYNCPANTSCGAVPCPHPSSTGSCGTYVQSFFIGSICKPNNSGTDSSCSYIGSPTECSAVFNCNYEPYDGQCDPNGSPTGSYVYGQQVNCD